MDPVLWRHSTRMDVLGVFRGHRKGSQGLERLRNLPGNLPHQLLLTALPVCLFECPIFLGMAKIKPSSS